MKILIAGASGAIGLPLMDLLSSSQREIFGITQSKAKTGILLQKGTHPFGTKQYIVQSSGFCDGLASESDFMAFGASPCVAADHDSMNKFKKDFQRKSKARTPF